MPIGRFLCLAACCILAARAQPDLDALVDATFQTPLTAAPTAVQPLADGRVYVSAPGLLLARLQGNGTVDPTFNVGSGVDGPITAFVVQPDGRVVIQGMFTTVNGVGRPKLARLQADGSVDPSFTPDPAFRDASLAPLLLADGHFIGIDAVRVMSSSSSGRVVATVRRFQSEGTTDASFDPVTLDPGRDHNVFQAGVPDALAAYDPQRGIYVGVQVPGESGGLAGTFAGSTAVFHLAAAGTRDAAFATASTAPLAQLFITAQGLLARDYVVRGFTLGRSIIGGGFLRLHFDGTVDPGFSNFGASWMTPFFMIPLPPASELEDTYNAGAAVTPDGGLLVRTLGRRGHQGVIRFGPDGRLDADFAAEIGADASAIASVHALANGQVLVAGSFPRLGSIARGFLARLTPNRQASATRLTNLSVRGRISGNPLIVGFITSGNKHVLLRAAGPALVSLGVPAAAGDPVFSLVSSAGSAIGENDDWDSALAPTADSVGAFAFASGSRDAAGVFSLPNEGYSLLVREKSGASAITLAELYDTDGVPANAAAPRLINISARGPASAGDDTLIAGFVVAGDATRNVLIRAVGPRLTTFGVPNPMPNPKLTVYRGSEVIGSNVDWAGDWPSGQRIAEAGKTVGAFRLVDDPDGFDYSVSNTKDSAVLLTLAPGAYTAIVTPADGVDGEALIEIYEIP